jgi:exosortase A-associated hydrolase 2
MAVETRQEVFFLQVAGRGQRLAVHHPSCRTAPAGALVYVHPFAEEMNKSRRMVALQSRALSLAGFAVLQVDLLGCGDSSGDLVDAAWEDWVDDVVQASRWMLQRHGAPLILWGLRSGCLLAAQAAQRLAAPLGFIFWQPATTGATVLQQFLRLEVAANMQAGSGKGILDGLRARLASGQVVDVAGYRVAPALAAGIERAKLEPPQMPGRVAWLEISGRADAPLLPASATAVARWRDAGHQVRTSVAHGTPFWHSVEFEESPALISATLASMADLVAA